jgi:hypothetical protein
MMEKLLVALCEAAIKAILATHLFALDRTVLVCGGLFLSGLLFWVFSRRGPVDVQLPESDSCSKVTPAPQLTLALEIHIYEAKRNAPGRTKRRPTRRKPRVS